MLAEQLDDALRGNRRLGDGDSKGRERILDRADDGGD